jgi:hypothetical protein
MGCNYHTMPDSKCLSGSLSSKEAILQSTKKNLEIMTQSSHNSSKPRPSYSPSFSPPLPFSSPSQDVEKPAIPYIKGQKFVIFRHIPPPPLGRPYPNSRAITSRKTLLSLTQFEYCLSAPPLGGFTNDQDASSFTVVEELDLRDGRGAQIV